MSTNTSKEEVQQTTFNMPFSAFFKIIILGAAIGLFTWLLALALDKYMLNPFFCQTGENVSVCSNSTVISSNISAVLVAVMAVPLLATIYAKRAILVVIAATIVLWGTAAWVAGSWQMSLLWTVIAYAAIYAVMSWINRLRKTGVVVVLLVLFVIAARLILAYA